MLCCFVPLLEPGLLECWFECSWANSLSKSCLDRVVLQGRSGTATLCLRIRSFVLYGRAVKVLVFTFL